MQMLKYVVTSILMFLTLTCWSTELRTVADVKIQFVEQLVNDQVITAEVGNKIKNTYVSDTDKTQTFVEQKPTFLEKNASWANFIKLAGILFLLIAFNGIVRNIIKGLWHLIISIPTLIYQLSLLSAGVAGLCYPTSIWPEQAYYVAMFSAFFNILIIGWIVVTYETIILKVIEFFTFFKLKPEIQISLLGMVYFGVLSVTYQSQVFGFFTAICFSGVLSFGMTYFPSYGMLSLHLDENYLPHAVLGHIVGLLAYIYALQYNVPNIEYFKVGAQYYCAVALCVALLIGASPFYNRKHALVYAQIFTLVTIAAVAGYYYLGIEGIGTILVCGYILLMLEWLAYIGYKAGLIVGCLGVGSALFGLGLAFERAGQLLVFAVK